MQGRPGIRLKKVKAHLSVADVGQGRISMAAFKANARADELAGLAAERHQLPGHIISEVQRVDAQGAGYVS